MFKIRVKRSIKRMLFSVLPSMNVLMFHHIDDGEIIVKSGCCLSKDRFIRILDSGVSFMSMDEYSQFSFSKKKACVVSFDDGLADVYRVAYPELKRRNIPFTVFIIYSFIDTEGYLTTQQLEILAEDPLVTIASHGITHEILRGMKKEEQEDELVKSKIALEKLIGKPVQYFAYSHGQYDKITLEVLQKEKCYKCAFVAGGESTNWITMKNKFTLPRINCEDNLDNFSFARNKRDGVFLRPKI